MQINVSQLLKSVIGTERTYTVESALNIDNQEVTFTGNARLVKTDRGILVTGQFSADILSECSRCLSRYLQHLDFVIEEEYVPTMDIVTGTDLPLPEDPGTFTIDNHNILDLSEAVRQYAILNMPLKPLCRPDCVGLCISCGANLNVTKCTCTAPVDPRWEKLVEIKSFDS
ncbi:MAG: DUF177 domain-containing protein [Dehalococcoidales bacterium]|nr:DUF177 domain-containing protein [Dehalococcoidales bacterium]